MQKIRLSASKLSLLKQCTFLFYLRYYKNFPNPSNSGSARGSVCHYTLECLLRPDRRDLVERMIKEDNSFCIPSVYRLIQIHAKKLGVSSNDNMQKINDFILVALKNDFYCDGAEHVIAELKINLSGQNYDIIGFLDKVAIYKDRISLQDYKTSSSKYTAEELQFNYQNLIYTLAIRKQYPELPIQLVFQFLKFKKNPNQVAPHLTDEQLKGFESYLEYVGEYLNSFGEKEALSDLAKKDIKRRWLCGKCIGDKKVDGSDAFICSAKYPRTYWQLFDETGKFIESSFSKKDLEKKLKPGYNIEMKTYGGCPGWKHEWET